jgi:hypothetical protein
MKHPIRASIKPAAAQFGEFFHWTTSANKSAARILKETSY